ncbi:MAG: hypothetical protein IM606_09970 [Cytophagales bacterium]|jgi:hypothetical protein|nr:hypothetical protein [Cytophagales bacterium]
MLPFSHKNNVIGQEVIAISPDERVILFKNIVQAAGLTVEELFLSGETVAGDYVLIAKNADDAVWDGYGDDQNLTLAEAVAVGQYNFKDQHFLDDLENRIFEAHIALED